MKISSSELFSLVRGLNDVGFRRFPGLPASSGSTFGANDPTGDFLDEEGFDTDTLNVGDRAFLDAAIADYNAMFGTSFDTTSETFGNYYKDLSMRLKNKQIDLVIVVNMFLTGFDATTLNTLFVDKNLRHHGLIQAFSRANRICNSVKTYGNIVSFRDLEQATNDAIALFGNKDAQGVVLLKPYGDYYTDYTEKVTELLETFPPGAQIAGESAQKDFITLFGAVLRLANILVSFDDFAGNEILTDRQSQDYRSIYLDLYHTYRGAQDAEKENINDDITFEIELIKQVEVNVDYILLLVANHHATVCNGGDRQLRADISRAVDASPTLRNKRDLIEDFVNSVNTTTQVDIQWQQFAAARIDAELDTIIVEENLKPDETRQFIERAFRDGSLRATGTEITRVLPPVSRFAPSGGHGETKLRVLERLRAFFDRFSGLWAGDNGVDWPGWWEIVGVVGAADVHTGVDVHYLVRYRSHIPDDDLAAP